MIDDYVTRARALLVGALVMQTVGAIGLALRHELVLLLPFGALIGIVGIAQLSRVVAYTTSFKIAMAISLFVAPINFGTLAGLIRRSMHPRLRDGVEMRSRKQR